MAVTYYNLKHARNAFRHLPNKMVRKRKLQVQYVTQQQQAAQAQQAGVVGGVPGSYGAESMGDASNIGSFPGLNLLWGEGGRWG